MDRKIHCDDGMIIRIPSEIDKMMMNTKEFYEGFSVLPLKVKILEEKVKELELEIQKIKDGAKSTYKFQDEDDDYEGYDEDLEDLFAIDTRIEDTIYRKFIRKKTKIKKEDCRVDTNSINTDVRITHLPSNTTMKCCEFDNQKDNFNKCVEELEKAIEIT